MLTRIVIYSLDRLPYLAVLCKIIQSNEETPRLLFPSGHSVVKKDCFLGGGYYFMQSR